MGPAQHAGEGLDPLGVPISRGGKTPIACAWELCLGCCHQGILVDFRAGRRAVFEHSPWLHPLLSPVRRVCRASSVSEHPGMGEAEGLGLRVGV